MVILFSGQWLFCSLDNGSFCSLDNGYFVLRTMDRLLSRQCTVLRHFSHLLFSGQWVYCYLECVLDVCSFGYIDNSLKCLELSSPPCGRGFVSMSKNNASDLTMTRAQTDWIGENNHFRPIMTIFAQNNHVFLEKNIILLFAIYVDFFCIILNPGL